MRGSTDVLRVARRELEHARAAVTEGLHFEVVWRTDDPLALRGLEQMLYVQFPDAVLNKIRPIALSNPNIGTYLDSARRFLSGQ